MRSPHSPQFLARGTYRIRRLMDAARFLPVLGLVLLLLPLMRHDYGTEAPPTAVESVYLFVVWIALIGAAFFMSLGLRQTLDRPKMGLRSKETVPPDPEQEG